MLAAVVTALRAVFLTYDGWNSPIYMAEESTQPTLTMPYAPTYSETVTIENE
jgi:hypothetical protein